MAYLVLARKWRPKGFDAITGQEHVTRTLMNAIAQGRVHHAFLFCGARGVGKTSAARVLARALNCQASEGPTASACGACAACREIAAGTSVDVFEIDGASNRGIGEIRELRDGVAYAPQRDRFKVYIIDEVHMLTTEAFNALLKTLEEPPAHVKFIFATTEPHKIPVTILSRCQRFDFKRIPMPIMVGRLSEILEAEGVRIDPAGLRLVARESEGSMRDALSLLDRVISACGQEATLEAVSAVLGVADRAWLNRLLAAAFARDARAGLRIITEAFDFGVDLRKFTADLVHHLRDLAMVQVAGDDAPTELSPDEQGALATLASQTSPEDVARLLRMAVETAERLVQASFPRLELEMLVIRMCRLHPVAPLEGLLQRLAELERRLTRGEGGGPLPKAEAQAKDLGPECRGLRALPIQAPRSPSAAVIQTGAALAVQLPPEPRLAAAAPVALDAAAWEVAVDRLRGAAQADPILVGMLDHVAVGGVDGETLTLEVAGEVTERRLASRVDELPKVLSAVLTPPFRQVQVRRVPVVEGTPQQRRLGRETARAEAMRAELVGHPLVVALQDHLGGVPGAVTVTAERGGDR